LPQNVLSEKFPLSHVIQIDSSTPNCSQTTTLGEETFVVGKTTSKVRPTSHLFVYYVESFRFVAHQIALLLQVSSQAVGSMG
jgi:hypothetical protein